MDSDGDGWSNGEELGDPDCTWTPGSTPKRTSDITHPGNALILLQISFDTPILRNCFEIMFTELTNLRWKTKPIGEVSRHFFGIKITNNMQFIQEMALMSNILFPGVQII